MANEHVLKTQVTFPIGMTCADGVAITKGSLLKLTDPNTVSVSAAANDIIAGIAYCDKIASDGVTKIAVITGPGDRLIAVASGSIGVGDPLVSAVPASTNLLASGLLSANLSGSQIVGFSKEAATVGQTFLYELNVGHGM